MVKPGTPVAVVLCVDDREIGVGVAVAWIGARDADPCGAVAAPKVKSGRGRSVRAEGNPRVRG